MMLGHPQDVVVQFLHELRHALGNVKDLGKFGIAIGTLIGRRAVKTAALAFQIWPAYRVEKYLIIGSSGEWESEGVGRRLWRRSAGAL